MLDMSRERVPPHVALLGCCQLLLKLVVAVQLREIGETMRPNEALQLITEASLNARVLVVTKSSLRHIVSVLHRCAHLAKIQLWLSRVFFGQHNHLEWPHTLRQKVSQPCSETFAAAVSADAGSAQHERARRNPSRADMSAYRHLLRQLQNRLLARGHHARPHQRLMDHEADVPRQFAPEGRAENANLDCNAAFDNARCRRETPGCDRNSIFNSSQSKTAPPSRSPDTGSHAHEDCKHNRPAEPDVIG
mmetsp:Transcript_18820/g.48860  ORF Transcript_18820/g.48860 Transcript_18820/m.48860 type:complete len:248 (+) Transcript_18820:533-1276(+)